MAQEINAITKYGPRVKQFSTVTMDRLVTYIAGRSGLNEGTISNVLIELREALLFFSLSGEAVKLDGLGTFSPKIGLDGTIRVAHLPDKWLKNRLNDSNQFKGGLINKENIGKKMEDLVDLWNQEHPDDLIKKKKK